MRKLSLAVLALLMCAACGGATTTSPTSSPARPPLQPTATPLPTVKPNPTQPSPASTGTQSTSLVASNNAFAFKLFDALAAAPGDKSGNVFVSPLSVGMALAMVYNGAGSTTAQGMAKALEVQGLSLGELNDAYAALSALLRSDDAKSKLTIANSVWARDGVAFKPDFLARTKQFFDADVTALDFTSPAAPQKINAWVNANTNGKIEKIVDAISPDMVMYLVNAIYMKADWRAPFDKSLTHEMPFNTPGRAAKPVKMMQRAGNMPYLKGDGFQAVRLPYADNRLEMIVFLPDANSSLADFQKKLTAENWKAWMSAFRNNDGDLGLPRFKLDYEVVLNGALKQLGMGEAFSDRADFSGMTQSASLLISEARHKSFLEVNEEGSEAAAATSVGMGVTSAREPSPRFNMLVDRPFFLAIRDARSGAIVFMGSVAEPK